MRRDWGVIPGETGGVPGDHEAVSRGMALANRFDGPTLEIIHDLLTSMDRMGGQLMIRAHRVKFDSEGNEIPRDQHNKSPGQWLTEAYVFSYETRDANVKELVPTEVPLEQLDMKAHPLTAEDPGPLEAVVEEVAA